MPGHFVDYPVDSKEWYEHGDAIIDFLWALRSARIITNASLQHVYNNSTWFNVDIADWETEQRLSHIIVSIDARDPNAKPTS